MIYKGIIKGKTVILDKSTNLTDGTEVEVIPIVRTKKIDHLCGSWQDARSAEEIIKDIRSSHRSKNRKVQL